MSNNIIKVSDIIDISDNLKDYKFHPATASHGAKQPLDDYRANIEYWDGWSTWRKNVDEFGRRRFIFTAMKFYYEKHMWLFGGIFEVTHSSGKKMTAGSYELKQVEEYSKFVGRLKIHFHRKPGTMRKAFNLETYWDELIVDEILSEPFSGQYPYKL